jgi:hypothetical protein
MNLTNLTTALFLVTTACGVVVEPSDDPAPTPGGPTFDEPPTDRGEDEPAPPSPLTIEAPRAAATPGSLFSMTFDSGARITEIVESTERTRIDVVEQKITTVSTEEVELVVELALPTGNYMRTLVSDTVRNGVPYTDHVLCESNGYATYDSRCETADPVAREMPSTGALTASQWKLSVVDDATGTPVWTCTNPGPNKISCVLPARAGVSYRILASAHGFANLWDGSANFGSYALAGVPYFGAPAPQSDWQCWDWRVSGSSMWCAARYEFVRFTAIDRARLDFDPITVRITANGSATAMATPALTWDPGNDDVPGSTY